MAEYPLVFRTSRWILGIVGVSLTICVAGAVHFSSRPGSSLETFGLGGLAVLFAIGLADGLFARVVLGIEFLEIVSNFRRIRVRRADIGRWRHRLVGRRRP